MIPEEEASIKRALTNNLDAFDIKIWEGTDTEADPFHRAKNDEGLAGGSIVIHKK